MLRRSAGWGSAAAGCAWAGGGATAADVAALRDTIVAGVRERFGITLVPEPVAVGW